LHDGLRAAFGALMLVAPGQFGAPATGSCFTFTLPHPIDVAKIAELARPEALGVVS
jgi:hypothetical protein